MRELTPSEFTDDDGSASPGLPDALAAYAADPQHGYLPALAALSTARVLVPVVAMLGEVEYGIDGLARDKTSDMATVLITGADGRTALLCFTSVDTLRTWDPQARPMPVAIAGAAQTALQEEAAALVLDLAGPHRLVVEGEDLLALARDWRVVRLDDGQWGWLGSAT